MSLKDKKFHIHTFGCQMNENDSEHIAGMLSSRGAHSSPSPELSDIVIINTCAVREKSEEKFFSLLGRLESIKKKKNLVIGAIGCIAQLYKSQLRDKKSSIDFIVGPNNYDKIPDIITHYWEEKITCTQWNRGWKEFSPSDIQRKNPTSGYVTIMRGCNNFCSYCIVPFTRGRERYRPMDYIIQEVHKLADQGYKEIQLLGQNVNSYRDPSTGRDFASLLEEVDRIPNIEWIRFLTSHPKNFTPRLAHTMKKSRKICRQLHLPLQSGSTSVLNRMNRKYSREKYLQLVGILKELMKGISLSTDIIVGYPGETEDEFQKTLSLLNTVKYTNIFSFRYSPRPLTPASKLPDSVPFETKKKRLIKLQNEQKKIQIEKNKSFIGKTLKVLCLGRSKKDSSIYSGRNEGYQVVNFQSSSDVVGQFVPVKITQCGPYSLFGESVD